MQMISVGVQGWEFPRFTLCGEKVLLISVLRGLNLIFETCSSSSSSCRVLSQERHVLVQWRHPPHIHPDKSSKNFTFPNEDTILTSNQQRIEAYPIQSLLIWQIPAEYYSGEYSLASLYSMYIFRKGDQNDTQYSRNGLTLALYNCSHAFLP